MKSVGCSLNVAGYRLKRAGLSLKSVGSRLKGTGFSPYILTHQDAGLYRLRKNS